MDVLVTTMMSPAAAAVHGVLSQHPDQLDNLEVPDMLAALLGYFRRE
jgi:hypothetical protein